MSTKPWRAGCWGPFATRLAMLLVCSAGLVCGRPCFDSGVINLCNDGPTTKDHEDKFGEYQEMFQHTRHIRERPRDVRRGDILDNEDLKNGTAGDDERDVVDREDHVTQYLSEMLVNTDSEITGLQASEVEEDTGAALNKEDRFFAFLTGLEGAFEIDGAWSQPAKSWMDG